jgi:hypothetical protein
MGTMAKTFSNSGSVFQWADGDTLLRVDEMLSSEAAG